MVPGQFRRPISELRADAQRPRVPLRVQRILEDPPARGEASQRGSHKEEGLGAVMLHFANQSLSIGEPDPVI